MPMCSVTLWLWLLVAACGVCLCACHAHPACLQTGSIHIHLPTILRHRTWPGGHWQRGSGPVLCAMFVVMLHLSKIFFRNSIVTKIMTPLGPTRAQVGRNPLYRDMKPSFLMLLEKQSIMPENSFPVPSAFVACPITLLLTTSNGLDTTADINPTAIAEMNTQLISSSWTSPLFLS